MNVTELVGVVGLSQSALSQHLARLREDQLVATRREAQTIWYRLADPKAARLLGTLRDLYCPPEAAPRHRLFGGLAQDPRQRAGQRRRRATGVQQRPGRRGADDGAATARGTCRTARRRTAARRGRPCASAGSGTAARPSRSVIVDLGGARGRDRRRPVGIERRPSPSASARGSRGRPAAPARRRRGARRRAAACVADGELDGEAALLLGARRRAGRRPPWSGRSRRHGSPRRRRRRSRAPRCRSRTASRAAKICPQQPWFLKVMSVMAKRLAEPGQRLVPLAGVLAGRGGEAGRAVQHIERAGHARARPPSPPARRRPRRGRDAAACSCPRRGTPAASPPAKVAAVAMACAVRSASQPSSTRGGGRRAEGADRAGGVPVVGSGSAAPPRRCGRRPRSPRRWRAAAPSIVRAAATAPRPAPRRWSGSPGGSRRRGRCRRTRPCGWRCALSSAAWRSGTRWPST